MKRFAPLVSAALFLAASLAGAAPATVAGSTHAPVDAALFATVSKLDADFFGAFQSLHCA